jgi:hypothetical protein
METIPTIRIEGLEEAIASLGELSRAIEKVTESVRLASSALSQFLPSNISSGFSLSATLVGMEPILGTDLTSAFPVSFLSETLPRVPEVEAPAGMLTAALTKLDQSTVTLRDAVDTLARTIPDLTMQPAQLIGVSPEQLQLQLGALQLNENSGSSFADFAAQTATGLGVALTTSGHPYIGLPVMAGGLAASWGLEESRTDSLFPYDEEAAEQMELIRSWGDISEVEDGLIFSRQGAADARARVFWDRFAFFAERLKELNELADAELSPLVDEPREFYRREQARSLRTLYSGNFLELIDRYKFAVGDDPTQINAGEVFNQLMRVPVGVDPTALDLAKKYALGAKDEIGASLISSGPVQLASFKPIEIQIQITSDLPVKTSTNNPNPNIRIGIIDMYSGPRMRW